MLQKPSRRSAILTLVISILLLGFTGVDIVFGADDLNLSETTLQPGLDSTAVSAEDYGGILDAFGGDADDEKIRQLLEQLKTQIRDGDAAGAEATRKELLNYIEDNPGAAPVGLNELLSSSLLEGLQNDGEVEVDLQSLSKLTEPSGDLGEDSATRAARLQELAQMFEENPALKDRLMDLANLINIGADEEARSLYGEIDEEIFRALLQMDPDLAAQALGNLGGAIGDTGSVNPPADVPEVSAPSDPFPNVGELNAPLMGASVPLSALPAVNLASPTLLLFAIVLPLLLLPFFVFQRRLSVVVPRVTSSVVRMIRPSEIGTEPADPRERVFFHFRRLVRVMDGRGVVKPDYETHREFAVRCAGRAEEVVVSEVSGLYEEARFMDSRISVEEADRCSRLVDQVERVNE